MKINKIYIPIFIVCFISVGLLIGSWFERAKSGEISAENHKNKLNKLIDFIDREYVDSVKTDSIIDLTASEILAKLDPHSVYLSPKENSAETEQMQGNFVGIGIQFYIKNDSVRVIKPMENGPSEKAGIKAGDRIIAINNQWLPKKNVSDTYLFSKLKGEESTSVTITVFRKSDKKNHTYRLIRTAIPIKSVPIALLLTPTMGYIKIDRFAETTDAEFLEALKPLKNKKIQSLVIDLRDNGGGYMERATKIADEFLKKGNLIVKTKNKKGTITPSYATDYGNFEDGKIIILINENSASASEVLAGAIQDNDRGFIIGRRSFGKGLVQREMPLGDGSAVRLTIARYYTPSGRSIQKPYNKGNEEYFNDFEKRFVNGELYESDKIKVADSLKFKTKKGRTVYGGGGIIPDYFVPIGKNHTEDSIDLMMQGSLATNFAWDEIDKNRLFFEKLSLDELKKEMITNAIYYKNFEKYILKAGLEINLQKHQKQIQEQLYLAFVRLLYSENQYYKLLLPNDLMIKKAIETL